MGFFPGKEVLASAIIVLAMSCVFQGSIDARLAAVTESFLGWCSARSIKPRLRKISKDKLGWQSTTVYPKGQWSKGSTTTYLLKWLVAAFEEKKAEWVGDRLCDLTRTALSNMNAFVVGIYGWEMWIPSNEGANLARLGLSFLKYQGRAAQEAYNTERRLFLAMPNLHRLHHIFQDMLSQSRRSTYIINPLAYSAQADEDYIGRPSRLSRRVSPRLTCLRTLQRSLLAARASYIKAGLLVSSDG